MSKSILQKKRLSIIKIVFAIAISFTFYLLPFTLRAQGSAFVATHQHRAILPGDVKNVSFAFLTIDTLSHISCWISFFMS